VIAGLPDCKIAAPTHLTDRSWLDHGERAMSEPALHARRLEWSQIVFQPSNDAIHRNCKQPFKGNPAGCPNFGKTWGCPPNAPPLESFKDRLETFAGFHVVYLETRLVEGYAKSSKGMAKAKQSFFTMTLALEAFMEYFHDRFPDALIIHGEGCHYCERHGKGACSCPGAPCKYPALMTYSLSVALDIFATMANLGIVMDKESLSLVRRIGFVATKQAVDMDGIITAFQS
jgi:predicted metal-binding protein